MNFSGPHLANIRERCNRLFYENYLAIPTCALEIKDFAFGSSWQCLSIFHLSLKQRPQADNAFKENRKME